MRWNCQGSGGGGGIPDDGSVTTPKLADNAVTEAKLETNAVTARVIAADAVGGPEIVSGAVGASEIATGAVGSAEVQDNSLTADDLASNSVGAPEIQSGAVGPSELQDNAVSIQKTRTTQFGVLVPSGLVVTSVVSCPVGWFATGGGWELQAGSPFDFVMEKNIPSGDRSWAFAIQNQITGLGITLNVDLWVSCIRLVM